MRAPDGRVGIARMTIAVLGSAAGLALAATFFRSLKAHPSETFFISWFALLSVSMFACWALAAGLERATGMRRTWSHFAGAVFLAGLFVVYQVWRVLVDKPQSGFDVEGILLPTLVLAVVVSMTTLVARRLAGGRRN